MSSHRRRSRTADIAATLVRAVKRGPVPESKGLIRRPGHHGSAVGRLCHVKHPRPVRGDPADRRFFFKARISPKAHGAPLPVWVSVAGQNLALAPVPLPRAHLAVGVDGVGACPPCRCSKSVCTCRPFLPPQREEMGLEGTPRESLHARSRARSMGAESVQVSAAVVIVTRIDDSAIPDVDEFIVAARCDLVARGCPLQAAHRTEV